MITGNEIDDGLRLEPVNRLCERLLGKRLSPATVWRWIKRGLKGGKLEAVSVQGKWYCTAEALADFLNRQTEANLHTAEPTQAEASDEQLRAAGLL
ncbi:MAG TPA: helix-turn-helix domain-containing protein [Planctomicrobium sp.]|nr:helix-turn-helix domain-containing protein [Planctomicrobium sp.]